MVRTASFLAVLALPLACGADGTVLFELDQDGVTAPGGAGGRGGPSTTTTPDPTTTPTSTDSCDAICAPNRCALVGQCDCGLCGRDGADLAPDDPVCLQGQVCGEARGYSADFGSTASVIPDVAFGQPITFAEPETVRSLAILSGGSGPTVRLGLYRARDGMRLLIVDDVTLGSALEVTEVPIEPLPLEAGDYFIVLHSQTNTPLRRTFNGDRFYPSMFLARD
ncbi:MAG: hypothetical protein AAGA56_10920, partial [Myxococcota bacterium]